jgi:hypothetical protein
METSTHGGQRLHESTEGSTHKGSIKKQPCLLYNGFCPRRTSLTRVDLHKVGDLLALTNVLVQLHIILEAPKRHLTNLGDTTLQKVIDVVVDDELLALVLQMIVSPTLKHSLIDLALVGERFEQKATWGRLEIKVQMVRLECLDLNT